MRTVLRRTMAAFMALTVAVTGYVWVVSREVRTEEYPTLAAAHADGALERGWIPPWIPDSARNLREAHDLDTNRRWLSLEVAPEEWWGVLEAHLPHRMRPVPRDSVVAYVTTP